METLGDRAFRFARPHAAPARIVDAVRSWPGVHDVVIASHDVAVYLDVAVALDDYLARVAELATLPIDTSDARDVTIQVAYDGEDLDTVATWTQLTVDEVI